VIASAWRQLESGTLQGFLTLTLPSGMVLVGCGLHQKAGARWVSMPSRPLLDRDGRQLLSPKTGKPSYSATVEFVSRAVADRFQAQALDAIDRLHGRESAADPAPAPAPAARRRSSSSSRGRRPRPPLRAPVRPDDAGLMADDPVADLWQAGSP
jgi:hypothetical protein